MLESAGPGVWTDAIGGSAPGGGGNRWAVADSVLLSGSWDLVWKTTSRVTARGAPAGSTLHSLQLPPRSAPRLCNHVPNPQALASKSGLLATLTRHCPGTATMLPRTFVVAMDGEVTQSVDSLRKFATRVKDCLALSDKVEVEGMPLKHCAQDVWIVKPDFEHSGRGISIHRGVDSALGYVAEQLKRARSGGRDKGSAGNTSTTWLSQKYIERPLLLPDGRKFDIRLMVSCLATLPPSWIFACWRTWCVFGMS
jgi:hypothetical protein